MVGAMERSDERCESASVQWHSDVCMACVIFMMSRFLHGQCGMRVFACTGSGDSYFVLECSTVDESE
jgi:hypothetical protein